MFREIRRRAKKRGHAPGTPTYTGDKHIQPVVALMTYNDHECHTIENATIEQCIPNLQDKLVTWVSVEGLGDPDFINQLAKNFSLHPLTVEDILNVEQRAKVEEFDNYIFITIKLLSWLPKSMDFRVRQFSLVLGKQFVLSFQEDDTTLFDNVTKRLKATPNQRLRKHGGDYLAYRLIDVVVDEYFTVLEGLGDIIEEVEERIIADPKPQTARMVYSLKRQMLLLRKAIWPMREAINHLIHVEDKLVTQFTRVYLRDVYDHTIQAVDTLETFRDMLASLLDMYLSSLTNRMNEIMKTLTIISTIFIPITAIASIYGMNFSNLPGLHWYWGYVIVISIMLGVAASMLIYFHRKHWL